MQLSTKQEDSWWASTRRDNFTIWDGAIRSGKTIISLFAFIHWLTTAPAGPVAIIGKTRTTIIRNVLDVVTMIAPKGIGSYGMSSDRVLIMGRPVWIIGANDAQAESKIRGLTLAGAYVDEATLLPEAMWVQLTGRLSVPGARLFATTNPDSPSHWLKVNYIDRAQELGWGFWHFTMDDNPGLTPDYVEAKKREFTGLWYRRFIQGEWVSAEGAIYDMWDPTSMVVPWAALPRMEALYGTGIDYGTQNPTSAEVLGLGEDGILYLVDEWRLDASNRGHGTWTDAQQSTALLEWLRDVEHAPGCDLKPQYTILDPAAASFKVQLRQDGAWGLTDGENDVVYGIRLLANGLSAGWLKISDRCAGFIAEAPGYSWDPKAQLAGVDKPIKTADHSLDAGRYVVATTERRWRHTVDQTALRLAQERKEAA